MLNNIKNRNSHSGRSGRADRRKITILAVVLLAVCIVGVILFSRARRVRHEVSINWTAEQASSASASFTEYGSGLIRYSQNGVQYMSRSGEEIWNGSYSMQNPRLVLQGDYGAVADIQGTKALIFNEKGICGSVESYKNILNLTVSGKGMLALVLDDDMNSLIQFFDASGKQLDIEISFSMLQSGYPTSLSLSPSGNGLAVAMAAIEDGTMQNKVVFYNFDVGKSDPSRMVGAYMYGDTLFPRVEYLSENQVCAIGDNKIVFYRMKNDVEPEVSGEIDLDTEIRSAVISEGKLLLTRRSAEADGYQAELYSADGSLQMQTILDFSYQKIGLSDDYITAFSGKNCQVLNLKGRLIFSGEFEQDSMDVFCIGKSRILQITGSGINCYTFR